MGGIKGLDYSDFASLLPEEDYLTGEDSYLLDLFYTDTYFNDTVRSGFDSNIQNNGKSGISGDQIDTGNLESALSSASGAYSSFIGRLYQMISNDQGQPEQLTNPTESLEGKPASGSSTDDLTDLKSAKLEELQNIQFQSNIALSLANPDRHGEFIDQLVADISSNTSEIKKLDITLGQEQLSDSIANTKNKVDALVEQLSAEIAFTRDANAYIEAAGGLPDTNSLESLSSARQEAIDVSNLLSNPERAFPVLAFDPRAQNASEQDLSDAVALINEVVTSLDKVPEYLATLAQ